jgi:ABC-type transporter Mla subunit MlaD
MDEQLIALLNKIVEKQEATDEKVERLMTSIRDEYDSFSKEDFTERCAGMVKPEHDAYMRIAKGNDNGLLDAVWEKVKDNDKIRGNEEAEIATVTASIKLVDDALSELKEAAQDAVEAGADPEAVQAIVEDAEETKDDAQDATVAPEEAIEEIEENTDELKELEEEAQSFLDSGSGGRRMWE